MLSFILNIGDIEDNVGVAKNTNKQETQEGTSKNTAILKSSPKEQKQILLHKNK